MSYASFAWNATPPVGHIGGLFRNPLLNRAVQQQLWAGEPTISVDTKKKELVGPFKNGGRELRPKGAPEQVRVHDFIIRELGRVTPYGVYDIAQNEAWVSVGVDHDTAAFAVESIRRWWWSMGYALYPQATRLLITTDAGGSNGYRLRLWKVELQKLADETRLEIEVSHFPPGTGKWNKIEHRLFSAITQNWRGKATGEPRSGGEPDWGDHDQDRTPSQKRTGHQSIPSRAYRFRR